MFESVAEPGDAVGRRIFCSACAVEHRLPLDVADSAFRFSCRSCGYRNIVDPRSANSAPPPLPGAGRSPEQAAQLRVPEAVARQTDAMRGAKRGETADRRPAESENTGDSPTPTIAGWTLRRQVLSTGLVGLLALFIPWVRLPLVGSIDATQAPDGIILFVALMLAVVLGAVGVSRGWPKPLAWVWGGSVMGCGVVVALVTLIKQVDILVSDVPIGLSFGLLVLLAFGVGLAASAFPRPVPDAGARDRLLGSRWSLPERRMATAAVVLALIVAGVFMVQRDVFDWPGDRNDRGGGERRSDEASERSPVVVPPPPRAEAPEPTRERADDGPAISWEIAGSRSMLNGCTVSLRFTANRDVNQRESARGFAFDEAGNVLGSWPLFLHRMRAGSQQIEELMFLDAPCDQIADIQLQ